MNSSLSKLTDQDRQDMNFAMRISLAVGVLLLFVKCYAWIITGSTAIFSDASESIIHVFSVGFAAYSMWLSLKPADENHPYGHDRISFFSAGFEGAMIICAAIYIIYEAATKILFGFELENLSDGIFFISAATVMNLVLGLFLLRKGKRYNSIILQANGKHILTDSWTSFGVIIALLLVEYTGVELLDPLIAIAIAINILWTGYRLIKKSIGGLMDEIDLKADRAIREVLDAQAKKFQLEYHQVKHRNSGNKLLIEFHLLFPDETTIYTAHDQATQIEKVLKDTLEMDVEVLSHFEPQESHDEAHSKHGV